MTIVAIVDDSEVDRYTVKRRLSKLEEFEDVLEFDAGDTFLDRYFKPLRLNPDAHEKLVVLMDINMPRMDGFETVAQMERHLDEGNGVKSCVVMMFSSSENPNDIRQAEQFDIVQGYIVKPFGEKDIGKLKSYFTDTN